MNPSAFYNSDSWLKPFTGTIDKRIAKCLAKEKHLIGKGSLNDFAMGHHYYGLHRTNDSWILREWAPNAINNLYHRYFYRLEREGISPAEKDKLKWRLGINAAFKLPESWRPLSNYLFTGKEEKENVSLLMPTGLYRMRKPKYSVPRSGIRETEYKWEINDFFLPAHHR